MPAVYRSFPTLGDCFSSLDYDRSWSMAGSRGRRISTLSRRSSFVDRGQVSMEKT